MHLTNTEIFKVVGFVIYFFSMFIYLKQLYEDLKNETPYYFREWIGFILVMIGAFTPVLNTVVAYLIAKHFKNGNRKR
tara:strand:+ start:1051 stop:1284 length:234 start_codon:yes stop_codon:yes gene_type:complete